MRENRDRIQRKPPKSRGNNNPLFGGYLFLQFPVPVSSYNALDPFIGIQQIADGGIMVQSVNDIGYIFAHVAVDIPFPLQKLRRLVD